MDSGESGDRTGTDGSIIHLIPTSWTTSPEKIQSIIEKMETVGEIWGTSVIVGFVDCLASWDTPGNAVCCGSEPDIPGFIVVLGLGEPCQVEKATICLKNWSRRRGVAAADINGIGEPISCSVGALVPDSSVGGFRFPGDIETIVETSDGRGFVALGANALVCGKIILLEGVGSGFVGRADTEEDTIVSSAITEPQLSIPNVSGSDYEDELPEDQSRSSRTLESDAILILESMSNAPRASTDTNLACGFRIVGRRWSFDRRDHIEVGGGNGIIVHRTIRTTAALIHCFQRKRRDFKAKEIEMRIEVVERRGCSGPFLYESFTL